MNDIEEKLLGLGVSEDTIAVDSEILANSSTIDQVKQALVIMQSGAGSEQYLRPIFHALYSKDHKVRERVRRELAEFGVPGDVIPKVFEKGSIGFAAEYEEQIPPSENREAFFKRAEELMLESLREYLSVA